MIIVIKDALDGRSFPEAGDYVYNLMLPFADTDEELVLDLQGVSDLPSLFFNMCLKLRIPAQCRPGSPVILGHLC